MLSMKERPSPSSRRTLAGGSSASHLPGKEEKQIIKTLFFRLLDANWLLYTSGADPVLSDPHHLAGALFETFIVDLHLI
jgi:hypothetical protein